ncbi:GumC family protein [Acidobacteriota bacterium]
MSESKATQSPAITGESVWSGIKSLGISWQVDDVFLFVCKHKKVLQISLLLSLILGILAAFWATPKYAVFAELYLDVSQDKAQVDVVTRKITLDITKKLNAEDAILRSFSVLEPVAQKYPKLPKKLNRDESSWRRYLKDKLSSSSSAQPKTKQELEASVYKRVRFLSRKLDIDPMPNSNIFKISLLAGDPYFGMQVLDDLLKTYMKHREAIQKFPGAYFFFEEQIEKSKMRLAGLEEELSQFQQDEKIIDYKSEVDRISAQLEMYTLALASNKKETITIEHTLREIKANLKEGDSQVIPSLSLFQQPFLTIIYSKHIDLRMELINLRQKFTAQDPQVLAAMQESDKINLELRHEVEKIVLLMESSLKKSIAEEEALSLLIEELKQQAEELPRKGKVIDSLTREARSEAATLAALIQKRNQEVISGDTDERLEDIKLLTKPTFSRKHKKPNKLLYIVGAACLGLFLGLGLSLVREFLDRSFHGEDQVLRELGLPVIGVVQDVGQD